MNSGSVILDALLDFKSPALRSLRDMWMDATRTQDVPDAAPILARARENSADVSIFFDVLRNESGQPEDYYCTHCGTEMVQIYGDLEDRLLSDARSSSIRNRVPPFLAAAVTSAAICRYEAHREALDGSGPFLLEFAFLPLIDGSDEVSKIAIAFDWLGKH